MRLVVLSYTVLFALLPLMFAHPGFSSAVRSDITLIPDTAVVATEKRGASPFVAGLAQPQPWPELLYNNRRIRLITYCYTNKATRDRLECNVINFAIGRWRVKLNSRGFSGTTNVKFEEAQDRASRTAYYCFDNQGRWNDNVPDDALWIDIEGVDGVWGFSTVGWNPPVHGPLNQGRHRMFLAWLNNPARMTDVATHEVRYLT
jgi:hypothetical protein